MRVEVCRPDFNGDSIADIVSLHRDPSDLSLTLGVQSTGSGSSTIGYFAGPYGCKKHSSDHHRRLQ